MWLVNIVHDNIFTVSQLYDSNIHTIGEVVELMCKPNPEGVTEQVWNKRVYAGRYQIYYPAVPAHTLSIVAMETSYCNICGQFVCPIFLIQTFIKSVGTELHYSGMIIISLKEFQLYLLLTEFTNCLCGLCAYFWRILYKATAKDHTKFQWCGQWQYRSNLVLAVSLHELGTKLIKRVTEFWKALPTPSLWQW